MCFSWRNLHHGLPERCSIWLTELLASYPTFWLTSSDHFTHTTSENLQTNLPGCGVPAACKLTRTNQEGYVIHTSRPPCIDRKGYILVHSLQNSGDLGASNPVLSDDLFLGNQMARRTEAADPATQLFGTPALAFKTERSERSDPFPKKPLPWKPWLCRFVSRPGTGLVLLNHLARRLILQDILLAKN